MRDIEGYGLYMVFMVVGSVVNDVNLIGFVNGIVWGMVFKVRIVIYKVCWMCGCVIFDIFVGFD